MLGYAQPLDFRTSVMASSTPDKTMGAVLDLRKVIKTEHEPQTTQRPFSTSPPASHNRPCSTSPTSSSALGSPLPMLRYSPVPQVLTHMQHHTIHASHIPHQSELPMMLTLTPPRDSSLSPPVSTASSTSVAIESSSPGLAVAQRVLAAASAPASGTRPFKAYPRDPLALSAHSESYLQFRQHMLKQVRGNNLKGTPPSRKRPASPSSPQQYHYSQQQQQLQAQQPQQQRFSSSGSGHDSDDKDGSSKERDSAYWERRRKNNEAAKRSRDARRAKEDEIAIRAAFLEQENLRLKYQVAALSDETAKLRCILYSSQEHKPTIHSSASA